MKLTNLGKIAFVCCENTDEAMREAEFRSSEKGWCQEINELSFPWVKSESPTFEAQLVEYPIHPYLSELDREEFKLPEGFLHGDHTHLLSYHKSLPDDQQLRLNITAAKALGRVFAGVGVMTLSDDGEGGIKHYRDPDSSMGNHEYEVPFRRGLGVHSSRGHFENFSFLIVRPVSFSAP